MVRGKILSTVSGSLCLHGLSEAPIDADSVADCGLCAATSGSNGVGKIISSWTSVGADIFDIGEAIYGYGVRAGHHV